MSNRNIAQKNINTIFASLNKIRTQANKNNYSWADSLFRSNKISGSLLHTLKAIISCMSLDRPTITQINSARTRSASRKFAQSSPVTDRTIRRHIEELETLELITVERTRDENRNSRNAYRIMAVEEYVSCRSEDIMSSSITLATSHNQTNTKIDTHTSKVVEELDVGFDNFQLAILATMLSWKTTKWVACGWIRKYTPAQLQDCIDHMNKKGIQQHKRGGYMRAMLQSLDKPCIAPQNDSKAHTHAIPGLVATNALISEISAYKRSDASKARIELAAIKAARKK